MNRIIRLSLLAAFALMGFVAIAQDTLFYTTGRYVTGRVEEIGVEMVRYRTMSAGNSVIIVAEKRDLIRIKLEGGQEFAFNPMFTDVVAEPEFLARTHAISVDFLAPALNHVTVGYEQVVGPRMSLVVKAGYIGLGRYGQTNSSLTYSGGLAKVGLKFIQPTSRRRIPTAREGHPLSGWYLRPELIFSAWSNSGPGYPYHNPYHSGLTITNVAFNMVVGRQVLLGERCTFDMYCGFGYGAQWLDGVPSTNSHSYYNDREQYAFSHVFFGYRYPLIMSGGMMFGYLF